MMGILDLWLPILVAAALMYVASTLIWVVFKWHNGDYNQLDDEEAARAGLRGNKPGFYLLPYCPEPGDLRKPEVKQKFDDGPLAYITMMPNGVPAMGPKLISMFIYFLVVAIICAYVVTRTLAPDADYLTVFRIAGTVAFVANSIALVPESIWFERPWSMTAKNFLDAMIYALLTGGVFGWLV